VQTIISASVAAAAQYDMKPVNFFGDTMSTIRADNGIMKLEVPAF
jgi:hypothetical protein